MKLLLAIEIIFGCLALGASAADVEEFVGAWERARKQYEQGRIRKARTYPKC